MILDLVFTAEQVDGDLDVRDISIIPLPWTDHYLVGLNTAPWFSGELRAFKQQGRRLERR